MQVEYIPEKRDTQADADKLTRRSLLTLECEEHLKTQQVKKYCTSFEHSLVRLLV
jgi:hypothetical protein